MIKKIPNSEPSKLKQGALTWTFINIGLLLMAISYTFFQVPNNFALGGIGGLSVVLARFITPHVGWLTEEIILAVLDALLILVGLIFLGKGMTVKTIVCSLIYSAETVGFRELRDAIQLKLPFTVTVGNPLGHPMLELCIAVLITGAGHALVFNSHASTGGTDIIALIIKKFSSWNISVALMAVDFLIACIPFFTFHDNALIHNNFSVGMYSVLGVFAKSFVIDGVIDNITKTKYVTIITVNPDIVKEVILQNIKRGFTKFEAYGGYTDEPRTVVLTVCRREQAVRLKAKLHKVDPTAFVIITDAKEILGKGFTEKV